MNTAAVATDPTNVAGRRIGAYFIDLVIYLVATSVMFYLWGPTKSLSTSCDEVRAASDATVELCTAVGSETWFMSGPRATSYLIGVGALWLLYHGVLQAVASTAGKAMLGLAVVDGSGNRVGMGQAIVRSLPLAIGASAIFIGFVAASIVGFIMILAHARHQRVGDLLAHTFVVRREHVGTPIVSDH